MKHKLMIKRHIDTGMQYLCYTTKEGEEYSRYKGSGVYWKKHLKKYGSNISTDLIFESDDYDEFKKFAISKSIEYDIINSEYWANLTIEEGTGGDTVSSKIWITNGIDDVYFPKNQNLPEGWSKGRSNCVFKDSNKQKEFAKQANTISRGEAIKAAWDAGKVNRDHSKCGLKGDLNPSKRSEVKEKIRQAALNQSDARSQIMKNKNNKINLIVTCPHCHKEGRNGIMKRWHFDNCREQNGNS